MGDGLHVDAQVVARRCSCSAPDYRQLTSLDWVVLDFADGLRTFEEILTIVPSKREDLAAAYIHLRLLGMLTWSAPSQNAAAQGVRAETMNSAVQPTVSGRDYSRDNSILGASSLKSAISGEKKAISLTVGNASYTDEQCAQFLPPSLFNTFRRYTPTLLDESLEMPVETQAFAEFLYENLSTLSPYDLLGLVEGQCDKAAVKKAYLLRTRQFHPDRYFRKNIGPFAPRIAAIFKAVTGAFTTLQSK